MSRDPNRSVSVPGEQSLARWFFAIGILIPLGFWFAWSMPTSPDLVGLLVGIAVNFAVAGVVALVHARLRANPPGNTQLDKMLRKFFVVLLLCSAIPAGGAWAARTQWDLGLLIMSVGFTVLVGCASFWLTLRTLKK